jgi:hypothetical protein
VERWVRVDVQSDESLRERVGDQHVMSADGVQERIQATIDGLVAAGAEVGLTARTG